MLPLVGTVCAYDSLILHGVDVFITPLRGVSWVPVAEVVFQTPWGSVQNRKIAMHGFVIAFGRVLMFLYHIDSAIVKMLVLPNLKKNPTNIAFATRGSSFIYHCYHLSLTIW